MKADTRLFYEFGEFRLYPNRHRLLRGDQIVTLTPKAFETLKLLVERPGIVIEREEFMDCVWRDAEVEPGNLDVAISKLRKALAEHETGNKFIETLPRLGYKFVAPVREVVEKEPAAVLERHTLGRIVIDEEISLGRRSESASTLRAPVFRLRFMALSATALTIILVTGVFAYFWRGRASSAVVAPTNIRSIAVLPFKTLDARNENSHQGMGMADILITRLSNLRQITVRPTSAVMPFENQNEDSLSIARRLKVDAILEGSIYRSEDKVRVTGRLLRVSDQAVLWSGQFERLSGDELKLQNEIALHVVDALALTLNGDEKNALTKRFTGNPNAYQLYLEGRYHWNRRNYEGLSQAQRLFRNALEEDPNFALAYVGLADSLAFSNDPLEMNDALNKALGLDPNLAEAYATKGFLHAVHFWKWEEAEAAFKKALLLNPACVTAHHWYAILLEIQGRYKEAEAEMQRALEINPLSYNFLADLGQVYYFAHDYEKAKEYCRRALEVYPDFAFAHQYMAEIYVAAGEYELATEEFAKGESLLFTTAPQPSGSKQTPQNLGLYRQVYESGGISKFWELRLSLLEASEARGNPNLNYEKAKLFALIGDKQKALQSLEKALEAKPFPMAWIKADPVFDGLRAEPRFQNILRKMNLPLDPQ